MTQILIAGGIALAVSILLTPVLIRVFSRRGFGQEIRVEGPQSHQTKRGTPSMGGVAIIAAPWAGYFASHLVAWVTDREGPTASGLLVLDWPRCSAESAFSTTSSRSASTAISA